MRPPNESDTPPGRAPARRPSVGPAPAGGGPGTLVTYGMTWRGDLVAAEDVQVDGLIEGTIESTGLVVIGERGRVLGQVSAARVIVSGTVKGNVAAARMVRVEPTGRVDGDVEARVVTQGEGARVSGEIRSEETMRQGRRGPGAAE